MPFFSGRREPSPPPREPTPPPVEDPGTRRRGLFGRHRSPSPPPARHAQQAPVPPQQAVDAHHQPPRRGGTGLFHRRDRSPSPGPGRASTASSASLSSDGAGRSSFGSKRTSLGGGLLSKRGRGGRGGGTDDRDIDPSILAARERIDSAEAAEQDAERALMAARESVTAARGEMRRLEDELKEDARRAKIKQQQASEVSKRGKALGRFG